MITIFSTPRAFNGIFEVIQENAIKSWLSLKPKPEIILLGDDKGIGEISKKYSLIHISDIKKNDKNTPFLNDIFLKAYKVANNDLVMFISADIIINPDLYQIVKSVINSYGNFLLVGQRLDLEGMDYAIDTANDFWFKELIQKNSNKINLHPPTGIDYFIHKKGLFDNMPPFLVGRTSHDNWMLYYAKELKKIPIIDLTKVMPVIHQNHPYFHPEGASGVWRSDEAKYNLKLAGGYGYCYTIEDANYYLDKNYEIKKKKFKSKNIFKFLKRKIQKIRDKYFLDNNSI